MQNYLNSSPLLLRKNSFLDKPLKNESQEEKTQSNISKNDNSVSFSQMNEESKVDLCDEDSSKNIWQDSENIMNDYSEESPFPMILNDKNPSKLNITVDENMSVDKSSSFNQSKETCLLNESNEFELCLNMPKLYEDEEKMSGYSENSFLSGFEISPNQEIISYDNNELNIYIIDGVKNDSIDINMREPLEEMKEKVNVNKNDLEEKKKNKFFNFKKR